MPAPPPAEAESREPLCWACGVVLTLPYDAQGNAAPKFRCGWCGAIASLRDTECPPKEEEEEEEGERNLWCRPCRSKTKPAQDKPKQTSGRRQTLSARCAACTTESGLLLFRGFNAFMFCFVVALIGSIVFVGYRTLFPALALHFDAAKGFAHNATFAVHLFTSAWLTFNVSYHYLCAVFSSAGNPPGVKVLRTWGAQQAPTEDVPQRTDTDVRKGVFTNFTRCHKCECAKPPGTHHCSTCKRCVMDLDHHCPFISNCVGLDNLRAFLLFLVYAVLGTGYVLALCAWVMHVHGDEAADVMRYARRGYWGTHDTWMGQPWDARSIDAESDGLAGSPETASARLDAAIGLRGTGGMVWGAMRSTAAHMQAFEASLSFFIMSELTPPWMLPLLFLVIAAGAVFFAVGFLLQSQSRFVWYGVPYIDFLQSPSGFAAGTGGLHQVRLVFGAGSPLFWLLPRWPSSLPPGVRSSASFRSAAHVKKRA